jgi:predicted aspartyl protease
MYVQYSTYGTLYPGKLFGNFIFYLILPTSTSRSTVESVLMIDSNFKVVDVTKYDILLSDIVGETISGLEIDGVKHLSSADDTSPATVHSTLKGITFGPYNRVLVMACLSKKKKQFVNAIMLVDTGSPFTFLTEETFKAIGINIHDQPGDHCDIQINGERTTVSISTAHFQDVNVLGSNFLRMCEVFLDYPQQKVQITVKRVLE